MKLSIETAFDVLATLSFDPNDPAFIRKSERVGEIATELFGTSAEFFRTVQPDFDETGDEAATIPYGLRAPFGPGLRVRVRGGPLTDALIDDARDFWTEFAEVQSRDFGAEAYREVLTDLPGLVRQITLFVFPIGIAYLRIHCRLPAGAPPDYCRAAMKCLEFGAYGDWSSASGAGRFASMLHRFRLALVSEISDRSGFSAFVRRETAHDYVSFSGFSGILLMRPTSAPDAASAADLCRSGDTQVEMSYGDDKLYYSSWLSLVVSNTSEERLNNRLLYMYMVSNVCGELCVVFVDRLTELMLRSLTPESTRRGGARTTLRRLNELKKFSKLLLAITDARLVSNYRGDIEIAERLGADWRTEILRDQIASAGEAFADAEAERLSEDARRRARAIGSVVFLLTVISLVGVVASIISSWREGEALLGDVEVLILVLSGPPVAAIVATLILAYCTPWRLWSRN